MDIPQLQQHILESDAFILNETKKLQYAYGLKHETRYIVERSEEIATESVAEHIYGLHVLADYFLPLEDPEQTMNWAKVHDMLQYHDIDEIVTGDKIDYLKTSADQAEEITAKKEAIAQFPAHMQERLTDTLHEYEEHTTTEAQFAKAVDRIEPLFQLFNENGKKILELQQTTLTQSISIKETFLKPFPYLYRFYRVIHDTMDKQGYFY
jgi:5'-deoxynucleotidase YfbR-like HD superfamily hydrolase